MTDEELMRLEALVKRLKDLGDDGERIAGHLAEKGGGPEVLLEEIRRLRGLIKSVDFEDGDGLPAPCRWCGRSGDHAPGSLGVDCPAFKPDGQVR